jgi:hypothetical protein
MGGIVEVAADDDDGKDNGKDNGKGVVGTRPRA